MIAKQTNGKETMSSIEQSLARGKMNNPSTGNQSPDTSQILALQLGQVHAQYALQVANMSVLITNQNKEISSLKALADKLNAELLSYKVPKAQEHDIANNPKE